MGCHIQNKRYCKKQQIDKDNRIKEPLEQSSSKVYKAEKLAVIRNYFTSTSFLGKKYTGIGKQICF